jgi:hypothetical protein
MEKEIMTARNSKDVPRRTYDARPVKVGGQRREARDLIRFTDADAGTWRPFHYGPCHLPNTTCRFCGVPISVARPAGEARTRGNQEQLQETYFRLNALRKNLPDATVAIDHSWVIEFHSLVAMLENVAEWDLRGFRVLDDAAATGTRMYDPRFIAAKMDALLAWFEIRNSPSPPQIEFRPR